MFIENDRFIIRKIIQDDTHFLHKVLSNPNVMRYIETPYTFAQTGEFITKYGLIENEGTEKVPKNKKHNKS